MLVLLETQKVKRSVSFFQFWPYGNREVRLAKNEALQTRINEVTDPFKVLQSHNIVSLLVLFEMEAWNALYPLEFWRLETAGNTFNSKYTASKRV